MRDIRDHWFGERRDYVGSPEEAEYHLVWHLNALCNFSCEYCVGRGPLLLGDLPRREHPDVGKFDPEHLAKCFDGTGKSWKIMIAGDGEPFLYPQFVELARLLTQKHRILIVTNLSTENVFEFADVIPPDRVIGISAASHINEREKRKNGVQKFIEKFLYLQEKGFHIYLEYVCYPPLLSRALRDIEYFKSQGIGTCHFRTFQGISNGKQYPESYTDDEKAIINQSPYDPREVDLKINAFGMLCAAGYTSFNMDQSGNLRRCFSSCRYYGNLFEQDYQFDQQPRPCPVKKCICPLVHEGLIMNRHGSASAVLKEVASEAYRRYRNSKGMSILAKLGLIKDLIVR